MIDWSSKLNRILPNREDMCYYVVLIRYVTNTCSIETGNSRATT